MTKDFIDEQIEVVEIKKTVNKSSKENVQANKVNSFDIAGVEVEGKSISPKRGIPLSEDIRKKISEAGKGRKHTEESKRKIAEAHKGRKRPPISEETRQRMRVAHANRVRKPLSEETKRKISEAHLARGILLALTKQPKIVEVKVRKKYVPTDETRAKLREASKGRIFTQETRKKISDSLKGTVFTEERRRKLREAHNLRDHSRPVMTPNGEFVSREALKDRLVADGVRAPTKKIREWFKLYPSDYYYIKKNKIS